MDKKGSAPESPQPSINILGTRAFPQPEINLNRRKAWLSTPQEPLYAHKDGLCAIYSTVTLFARFLGLSTSRPLATEI